MDGWPRRHVLVLAGGIALLLALVLSAVGFLLYGQDMTPNLIAEMAGVSVEVAIAALVVERLMSRHQRETWDFAYRGLAKRASEAFVDVMRLITVHASEATFAANVLRYGYFVQLTEQHLGDFRSHIEGAAAALDPHTHEEYRRIERRLGWCLGQLHNEPTQPGIRTDLLALLRESAELMFRLLSGDGDGHHAELAAARTSVERATSTAGRASTHGIDAASRLQAQALILKELQGNRPSISSIVEDVESNFSIAYFMIDYILLKEPHVARDQLP